MGCFSSKTKKEIEMKNRQEILNAQYNMRLMAKEMKKMSCEIEKLNKLTEIQQQQHTLESEMAEVNMEILKRKIAALEKDIANVGSPGASSRTDTSWSNYSNSRNYDVSDSESSYSEDSYIFYPNK